jgi:isopropylmalate/homocitrate/citramalate synthase
MKPQVEIYDTTLRDGSQGEGINFIFIALTKCFTRFKTARAAE